MKVKVLIASFATILWAGFSLPSHSLTYKGITVSVPSQCSGCSSHEAIQEIHCTCGGGSWDINMEHCNPINGQYVLSYSRDPLIGEDTAGCETAAD